MFGSPYRSIFFFFNDTATTEIYTLSLHDALPISPQGGVQIGALTKLAEIAESDLLAKKYPMLVQAVKMISSPELRNASTLGGDLLQEVWCQYLRGGYSCWRNGGYICYGAIGDNSYYHSPMGGRLCYAVYPGDAAPPLITLDATVKVAGPSRLKKMSVEQLLPRLQMVA